MQILESLTVPQSLVLSAIVLGLSAVLGIIAWKNARLATLVLSMGTVLTFMLNAKIAEAIGTIAFLVFLLLVL